MTTTQIFAARAWWARRPLWLAVVGACLALGLTACAGASTSASRTGSAEPGEPRATASTIAPASTGAGAATAPLPSSVNVSGKHACDLLSGEIAATAGVDQLRGRVRNKWGTVCSYDGPEVYLFVLLTDGPRQGLAQLPVEFGTPTKRRLGRFPARQVSDGAAACSLEVEVVPGRVLSVRYSTQKSGEDTCKIAEALVTQALANGA